VDSNGNVIQSHTEEEEKEDDDDMNNNKDGLYDDEDEEDKEFEAYRNTLGYFYIGRGGRDEVIEEVTGKLFSIHGGKSFQSPEPSSSSSSSLPSTSDISPENYAKDMLFWEEMSSKYRASREAICLIRCFYKRYNTSKLSLVDKWSIEYQGQEVQLLEKITRSSSFHMSPLFYLFGFFDSATFVHTPLTYSSHHLHSLAH
jgi:hypothetical protein